MADVFKVEENEIFTKPTLAERSGLSYNTVASWFEDGLKHNGGRTTGRAVLEYFERDTVEKVEEDPLSKRLREKVNEVV